MRTYGLDVDEFWRQGVSWPVGRIDVHGLADHFFDVQRAAIERRGREVHISPHLISKRIDSLVHDPVILDEVEKLLGPDLVMWESDFARKPPGSTGWVPWHSDGPYWNLSTNEVVSVWVALTDVKVANAAMQVVPRTHLRPDIAKLDYEDDPMAGYGKGVRTSSNGNVFNYDTILADDVDPDRDAVAVELEPGEFSIHHVDLLHGGGPNTSEQDRIGFAMRYMSSRTYCRTGTDSVMKMRGNAPQEHFVFESRPETSFSDEAWAEFDTAMTYPSGFGDRTITAARGQTE